MRHLTLLTLWFLSPLVAVAHNQLAGSAVPYLAMHATDPVQWQPWQVSALTQAQRENKLLYISIGYFACHWCHVMQRESYKNPQIAALINKLAVAVKVDRELQPALDAALIEFVEKTNGNSGWPLNVFLTPDGYPLVGFVYLPPQQFKTLLVNLTRRWEKDHDNLSTTARQAAGNLVKSRAPAQVVTLNAKLAEKLTLALREQALLNADELAGGFGDRAKFPMAPLMVSLLCDFDRSRDKSLGAFLQTSFDQMAEQGLHDHIEGGFFRYTVDPGWQTPHFEKMLYDNAQLARLYLLAGKVFGSRHYTDIGEDTLNFLIKSFSVKDGGYIASLSAVDNQGVEGGYYLVNHHDLNRLFDKPKAQTAADLWQLHKPSVDTGALPIPQKSMQSHTPADKQAAIRQGLIRLRSQRQLPRDHKRIAAWNALLLMTFTTAADLTGKKKYQDAGRQLRDYLAGTHWDGKKIHKMRAAGQTLGEVSLQDYAYMSKAFFMRSRMTDSAQDQHLAALFTDLAWDLFFKKEGWRLSQRSMLPWIQAEPVLADGPLPSASALLQQTSLALAAADGNSRLMNKTLLSLGLGFEKIIDSPMWYASHIKTIRDHFNPPREYCRY